MEMLRDYLVAADSHNLASSGGSWYNPLSWDVDPKNTFKFAAASILSGTNSVYNTLAAVGRWGGLDTPERDTNQWISSFDSDLGQYYRQNQEAADLVGFIGTAIIPGMAGVKALNLGQMALKTAQTSGLIGGNLARATGLLVPNTQKYVALAATEINSTVSAAKLLNSNTLKALGAGIWQNTLEAAAAETVIQATMFRSPILENQDVGDVITNIAVGGAFGAVVGGAFSAAKIRGDLKAAVREEGAKRAPFVDRPAFASITSPGERISALAYDSEMTAVPIQLRAADGSLVQNNYSVNKQLYESKLAKNADEIRTAINGISDDSTLGNMLANASTPLPGEVGFAQKYLENFTSVLEITRAGTLTKAEIRANKQLIAGELQDIVPEARYVKLVGENAGRVEDGSPLFLTLGDLHAGKKEVRAAVGKYKFSTKELFDTSKLQGTQGVLKAEARQIWADDFLKAHDLPETNFIVHENDIPLLEKAYELGRHDVKIVTGDDISLEVVIPESRKHHFEILKERKLAVANELLRKMSLQGDIPVEQGTAFAAKITNTKQAYLEGFPSSTDEFVDLFAHQSDRIDYVKSLKDRNLSVSDELSELVNPYYLPKYAKVVYDTKAAAEVPGTVVDAMVWMKSQQKIYEQGAKNVVSRLFGTAADSLPDISDTALFNADRVGSGPGLVSFENSNYGSIGSTMAWIGSITRGLKERFRSEVGKNLEHALVNLGSKSEAAIEFQGINQKVTRSGQLWVHHVDGDGANFLVTRDTKKLIDAGFSDEVLSENVIAIVHPETRQAILDHIRESGKRTRSMAEIRGTQGRELHHDPSVFRPIRPDLRLYPHFAFVEDTRVTGSGHMTMIHAASEKELAALIDRVPSQYTVRTKTDVEEFKRARFEYEHARTLNENYINSDLANHGVFSEFFPKSDPTKIVDDILQQHYRESDILVQEGVRLRYEAPFSYFEDLGKRTSKAETSRFASRSQDIEKVSDNPYFNYIKTALDISKAPENRLIYGFNKLLDESVSKAVSVIRNTWFSKVSSPEDLEKINQHLDEFGIKPAYYDSSLQLLANHTAPRGELTKFVRRANSALSLFTLGLDPLNALNNAIGSNILRFTELRHLTKAIAAGDEKIAGELGKLAKIQLPGVGDSIFSPTKLVAQAIKNYFSDMFAEGSPLMGLYRTEGIIKSRDDQLKLLIDDFTLKGTETVAELNDRMGQAVSRLKKWTDKGERLTLNAQAEEFNRFISANVMDQISDVAVRNGLMSPAEAKAYRNTFVNRVEGNILASQRPLIFQGPIGQAISLFQSYQFNLIQQLFRYVAEGSKKDVAMLAGLQSTLYGIQSLPAFQFVNTHIVGQLSGNKEHRDTYDAVYGTLGKTAGNFFLYGLPSNILQTNIYSRGDINPRQLTVLPTTLQELPIVSGWGKFLLSAKETFSKVAGGGNVWESILQGVEHNGISRPMAGFAQTLQGIPGGQVYSTSSQGSILYSNDLFHLSTLSRLAGGRPLDEAIVNDALYRVKSYEATRRAQLRSLAETVKTTLIGGNTPTSDQIDRFAERHAELGGKQGEFNKYMMQLYKSATVPQAQTLGNSLRNPFAYKMQLLMGGDEE